MNIKSLRKILWNSSRPARPVHVQLEFQLPSLKLTRSDLEILEGLRRLREDLSRD
ncbi:MAG: hypothetical protein WCO94_10130 [Verrucomicrobiota bacterium]